MPGLATKCASWFCLAASNTCPKGSKTRTALALHGRQMSLVPATVCSAKENLGSRTVKYWVPWSKVPNTVSRVDMRPAAPRLFSNMCTRCPAWTRVRAAVMPAMPAPMMAIWSVMAWTLHAVMGFLASGKRNVRIKPLALALLLGGR